MLYRKFHKITPLPFTSFIYDSHVGSKQCSHKLFFVKIFLKLHFYFDFVLCVKNETQNTIYNYYSFIMF